MILLNNDTIEQLSIEMYLLKTVLLNSLIIEQQPFCFFGMVPFGAIHI